MLNWEKREIGFSAIIENVTLSVAPDRVKNGKPARGTKWRAFISRWDEPSKSSIRFGRDIYNELQNDVKSAIRFAENVWKETNQ